MNRRLRTKQQETLAGAGPGRARERHRLAGSVAATGLGGARGAPARPGVNQRL